MLLEFDKLELYKEWFDVIYESLCFINRVGGVVVAAAGKWPLVWSW